MKEIRCRINIKFRNHARNMYVLSTVVKTVASESKFRFRVIAAKFQSEQLRIFKATPYVTCQTQKHLVK